MLPEIKIDTDQFQDLIEESRTMLAGIYPEWTDFNYHDPGMTFLDLFAWMKENQQFYMEQLSEEHYETFFKLLGSKRRGRSSALVLAQPEKSENCYIPPGTCLRVGDMDFETLEEENLLEQGLKKAVSHEKDGDGFRTEEALFSKLGELYFFPFGEHPKEGNYCTFFFGSPIRQGRTYHLFFQVAEGERKKRNGLAGWAMIPLAQLSWHYYTESGWKPLKVLYDETENFLFDGRVCFVPDEEMMPYGKDGNYVLRVFLNKNHYDIPPLFSGISINQIALAQKKTWNRQESPVLIGEGTGFPRQRYELPGKEPKAFSVKILTEDPLHAGQLMQWKQVYDFAGYGPEEPVFTVDEDRGQVCFGDGFRGLAPEGSIYLSFMEETKGYEGNVKLGTVLEEGRRHFFVSSIVKKGYSRETIEEALVRLCTGRKIRKRAITAQDYEELVKETPGLIVYSCKVLKEQSRDNQVAIVVRPGNGKEKNSLSEEYRKNILKYLDGKRLIGTRIRLLAPEYIEVNLYLEATVFPQYLRAREMVMAAVRQWFSRLGETFGQVLSYGELYGLIDSLACIRHLRVMNLESDSVSVTRNLSGDLIPPPGGVFLLKQVDYVAINE